MGESRMHKKLKVVDRLGLVKGFSWGDGFYN